MKHQARALRIEQTNRLKTLGLAFSVALTDHPQWVITNLNQLVGSEAKAEDLIDPINGKPFTLVGPIDEETRQYPSTIVIYGAPATGGGGQNAVMADGSVQGLSAHRFAAQMKYQATIPNKWVRKLMPPESGQN